MPGFQQAPGWNQFMEFLKAMEFLNGKYPAPQVPGFQAPQGLTPGQEGTILNSMSSGINKQVGQNLNAVRVNAAQRGAYRSGQLPQLETSVRNAGTDALQNGLSSYYGQKSNQMYGANMAQNSFNSNIWQQLFQSWQQSQAGMGQLFGSKVRI